MRNNQFYNEHQSEIFSQMQNLSKICNFPNSILFGVDSQFLLNEQI